MRHTIHVRHYSIRTEASYISWIRRFILFNNKRHPGSLSENRLINIARAGNWSDFPIAFLLYFAHSNLRKIRSRA
ncbi:MAG: phage integrase N-terminal SAM-like domain-containing protein [Blastocatellia bacterium]